MVWREYVEAFQRQVIAQNNHPGLEERLKEGYNEVGTVDSLIIL